MLTINTTENVHREDPEGCFAQDGREAVDARSYFHELHIKAFTVSSVS